MIVGDFNFRAAYGDLASALVGTLSPVVRSVQGSDQAAPSRAVVFYGVPVETASTSCRPLAGVPHHKAVCYQVQLPVTQNPELAMPDSKPPLRIRRCAAYVWLSRPSPVQAQQLQQAA